MGRKRHKPEEIVAKLRQVDVLDDARAVGCGSHSIDRRYGSDVLPLAPGIWPAMAEI